MRSTNQKEMQAYGNWSVLTFGPTSAVGQKTTAAKQD
jgi:hypothetical protein